MILAKQGRSMKMYNKDININYQQAVDMELNIKDGLDALVPNEVSCSFVRGVDSHTQCESIYGCFTELMQLYRICIEKDADEIKEIAWDFNLTDVDLTKYIG